MFIIGCQTDLDGVASFKLAIVIKSPTSITEPPLYSQVLTIRIYLFQ